ncbi:MAG: hypothetical protein ACREN8_07195, partial [Candidatus Dormibacteraceae bacterium]
LLPDASTNVEKRLNTSRETTYGIGNPEDVAYQMAYCLGTYECLLVLQKLPEPAQRRQFLSEMMRHNTHALPGTAIEVASQIAVESVARNDAGGIGL